MLLHVWTQLIYATAILLFILLEVVIGQNVIAGELFVLHMYSIRSTLK